MLSTTNDYIRRSGARAVTSTPTADNVSRSHAGQLLIGNPGEPPPIKLAPIMMHPSVPVKSLHIPDTPMPRNPFDVGSLALSPFNRR